MNFDTWVMSQSDAIGQRGDLAKWAKGHYETGKTLADGFLAWSTALVDDKRVDLLCEAAVACVEWRDMKGWPEDWNARFWLERERLEKAGDVFYMSFADKVKALGGEL